MAYERQVNSLNYLRHYIQEEDTSLDVSLIRENGELVKLVVTSPYSTDMYCVEWISTGRFLSYIEDRKTHRKKSFYISKTNKGTLGRINELIDLHEDKMRRELKKRKRSIFRLTEEE
ncbi:hypothetical protein [Bacillus phage Sarmo]|nr:hypothetical protein [Bacillus phage Sarmo]